MSFSIIAGSLSLRTFYVEFLKTIIDEQNDDNIKLIKHLSMLSNFTIDFPKTQRNIVIPKEDMDIYLKNAEHEKVPYFFHWAKKKKLTSVAPCNESIVNKINQNVYKRTNGLRYKYDEIDFDYSVLQSRDENGEVIVHRSSAVYSEIYKTCYKYGKQVQFLTGIINGIKRGKDNDSENSEDQINAKFDLLYSMCLDEMMNSYPNNGRDKHGYVKGYLINIANILVDICYCQEKRPIGINQIMWNCVGDILVDNIIENQKKVDYTRKTRTRTAYTTKRLTQLDEQKEIVDSKLDALQVNIFKRDIEKINEIRSQKARKDTNINLQKLYFALLCLCKNDKKGKVAIFPSSRSKNNPKKIMKMAGLSCNNINTLLKKLVDLKLIEITPMAKKQGKTIMMVDHECSQLDDDIIVITVKRLDKACMYYQAYMDNKKLSQCAVCGQDYIKDGNKKTCSDKCSEILNSITKQDNYRASRDKKAS